MTATVDTAAEPRRNGEAPLTLEEPAPRVLGWLDQIGLWGNLGVTLLAPVGASYVLLAGSGTARLSFLGAGVAVVVGTVLGALMIAAAAVPGAQTGAPSMVLLRGLFGRELPYLPTAINVLQLLGWTVFEIVVIASAAQQLFPWHAHRWPYVVIAGVLTAVMTVRPLGAVRILRRYALGAVVVTTTYLFIQLLRQPMPSLTHGSWSPFWAGADVTIAVAVSWAPLASDYSRHSRSPRSAFGGALVGYTITQVAGYALGLVALATVVRASDANLQPDMFGAFIAVPVGWLAFGVLVLRELDESFADGYSAVVSLQNVWPRVDRRLFTVVVVGLATVGALVLNINDYVNFLTLLASVLVPLVAVFLVDYFGTRAHRDWDVTADAPSRLLMLTPWALGFVVYQLINPGSIGWWSRAWAHVDSTLHLTVQSWMSASVLSFLVAGLATVPFVIDRRRSGDGELGTGEQNMSRRLTRAERVLAYGLAGWCSEVLTTGLRSRGRDGNWRLTSTTYLWMLPIYGLAAEATRGVRDDGRRRGIPWWHRGVAWAAGIYAVEAASGEALRALTGEVPWDYARARGGKPVPTHWRGLVRPAYAPVWFLVGLGAERLDDVLDRLRVEPGQSG